MKLKNLLTLSIVILCFTATTPKKNNPPKELTKALDDLCVNLKKNNLNLAAQYFDVSLTNNKSQKAILNFIKSNKELLNFLCEDRLLVKYEVSGKNWIIDLHGDHEFYFGLSNNKWKMLKHINNNVE